MAPCHSQPDGAPSAADPPSGPLNVPPTRAKSVREERLLPAPYRIPPAMATAGRHHRACAPTSRRPHHHLLESGLARSPSPTHQPLCQRQRQSLRWIRAKEKFQLAAVRLGCRGADATQPPNWAKSSRSRNSTVIRGWWSAPIGFAVTRMPVCACSRVWNFWWAVSTSCALPMGFVVYLVHHLCPL